MQKLFDFNYDWQFFSHGDENITLMTFDKIGEDVTIPHTPRIEELDVVSPFSGVMYYRKLFKVNSELAAKKLFIDFEGVMSKAVVYLNGKKIATHFGGYLPFSVDITRYIKVNANNLLVVEVDNRDDKNVPPGKPTPDVDFLYYGGIYRNVRLRAVDKVYVDVPWGKKYGGVFVHTDRITDIGADVSVDIAVTNEYFKHLRLRVKHKLISREGMEMSMVESNQIVADENKTVRFTSTLVVTDPVLWDIDNPYLYTLVSSVYANDELVDEVKTPVGIRMVAVDRDGFMLNYKHIRLNGVNRHQQFPYIGIAGSDNADYRDIAKLKEAGFNIVRLSHYPQSEAVMRACDELGIMAIVCTPGWQFCKRGVFKRRVIDNIREMVRRDRNHPSAVIWEASLNETGFWNVGATDHFFKRCVSAVREEFAPHDAIVCGDTIGRHNWQKIGYDIPFTGWNNKTKIRVLDGNKLGMTREYGDYEFGGHNSNTRVRIADGEMAMRIQAHNFQWSHNMNVGSKYELGDLIWEGIDHNRGMGKDKPISTSGIFNEWRLPKYSYYLFRSQRSDTPVVFLPTRWACSTNGKLTVFSNADEVEIRINGQKIARRTPNSGETQLYDAKYSCGNNSVDYWQNGGLYDTNNKDFDLAKFVLSTLDNGGNCANLRHAPFTFDNIAYEEGEIEAIAYQNGKQIAVHKVYTPGEAVALRIEVDYSGKPLLADGRDVVFVHTYVVDCHDTPVVQESGEVTFEVTGGAVIASNKASIEAGVASCLVRADRDSDKVVIKASYRGKSASCTIDTKKVEVDTL